MKRGPARGAARALLRPAADAWHGLERCLEGGWPALAWLGGGMLAGWWLYVPVHELLHAAACRLAGGEVTRLQIAPLYGGALLARLLPFVAAGGAYAGRLAGFDTRGSDLVYLATDLGPYLLTVFPGVWWLRRAARSAQGAGSRGTGQEPGHRDGRAMPALPPPTAGAPGGPGRAGARRGTHARRAVLFGAALPVALAPFLSLTGDAYEIGSILVTRLAPWSSPAARTLLRGDDLGLRLDAIAASPPTSANLPKPAKPANSASLPNPANSASLPNPANSASLPNPANSASSASPASPPKSPNPASTASTAHTTVPPHGRLWAGVLLACLAGLAWALLTYGAGAVTATALGQPPLTAPPPPPASPPREPGR